MITAKEIEGIEIEAWQNMFDIAPPSYKKEMQMSRKHIAGGTCLVFPKYPLVHFNMVMGLGFSEPITGQVLQEVEQLYANENQSVYIIHYCEEIQDTNPTNIFEETNYKAGGGWERIVWKPAPITLLQTKRNIHVEKITSANAAAWEKFIIDCYHYPVKDWLLNFITDGWHHFAAYENGNMIACRSIYTGTNNMAWSGVEAPVPVVMTNDLEPDRILWKHIQQFCYEKNVTLLVADIEVPHADRDAPVYHSFRDLGFEVKYLRKLMRKKPGIL